MTVSKRLRYEILRRDDFTCRYCGCAWRELDRRQEMAKALIDAEDDLDGTI